MSRRSPRVRARFAATVQIAGVEHTLVCHTRDISTDGCFLDTSEEIALGVNVSLALMDNERGEVVQVEGTVARRVAGAADGSGRGIGVHLDAPPPEWQLMVQGYQQTRSVPETSPPPVRLAVLVVGDEQQRRGALALYVMSGWDIRFAVDLATAEEALSAVPLDAVIAEFDGADNRWPEIFAAARRIRPRACRILRAAIDGAPPRAGRGELVNRLVAPTEGLEGLFEAVGAELTERTA